MESNPDLAAAPKVHWHKLALQRCTNHELWNLLAKVPTHLREELAEDYRRMIYVEVGFVRKWRLRCKAVALTFEEASDDLFTFTAFPASQWKSLRTTNALERINEEFRRRTRPRLRSQRGGGPAPAVRTPAQRTVEAALVGRLARPNHRSAQSGGCVVVNC
jgi:transposase-like protein